MFWRKKSDGFEWQEYVRTTILLRRQDRHNKIEAAKQAAVDGLKDAGRRGIDASAAGAVVAGSTLWSGAQWLATMPFKAACSAWSAGQPHLAVAREHIARVAKPLTGVLNRPMVFRVLGLIAICACLGTVARTMQFGFDADASTMAVVAGVASMLMMTARFLPGNGAKSLGRLSAFKDHVAQVAPGLMPTVRFPAVDRSTVTTGAAIVFVASMIWLALPSVPRLAQSLMPTPAPEAAIAGTASVLSANTMRISGAIIRLAGLETPDDNQTCTREGQKIWRCGAAAKAALEKLARGRKVACAASPGGDPSEVVDSICTVNGRDIGADLVRSGFAFSAAGLLSSAYAIEEDAAKTAKAGLWSGVAERREDWRARVWEEASRVAPGGCPIKGRVTSGSRVYVLPWSAGYSKVTVRDARGERWFCSEDEAQSSGWSPLARS